MRSVSQRSTGAKLALDFSSTSKCSWSSVLNVRGIKTHTGFRETNQSDLRRLLCVLTMFTQSESDYSSWLKARVIVQPHPKRDVSGGGPYIDAHERGISQPPGSVPAERKEQNSAVSRELLTWVLRNSAAICIRKCSKRSGGQPNEERAIIRFVKWPERDTARRPAVST